MKNKSAYSRALNEMLDEIFEAAGDMTLREMASASDLCYETVRRIWARETACPYFRTVWKLAGVVGMQLMVTKLKAHRKAG